MPHGGWSEFHFEGIGTAWEISTPERLPGAVRRGLLEVVEDYDLTYSRFRDDSVVSELAARPGSRMLPPEAENLARVYSSLYRLTRGAMTPLIAASLERLGYGPDYALRPQGAALPAPVWEDVLEWSGRQVTTMRPVMLDIGAAGKGQLADILAGKLNEIGIDRYLVDGSGDMLHSDPAPLEVALEHPYDSTQAIGVVELHDGALCASAANRRAWGDGLHHVLDGATGRPIETVVATWTMAATAMEADALATALFMVDPKMLEEEFDFSWLNVYSDGRAAYSAGFEGTLFS